MLQFAARTVAELLRTYTYQDKDYVTYYMVYRRGTRVERGRQFVTLKEVRHATARKM